MLPSETVLRCIKRLGGTKSTRSASQRWSKKKQQNTISGEEKSNTDLLRVTELADQLLQAGDFDIYQKTRGQLETDELEALGKAFDDDEDDDNVVQSQTVEPEATVWQLKYSETEDAALEGPYSSSQLKQWVEEGKFKSNECVLVRKSDQLDGQFYNVNRIDFELYE